MGLSKVEEMKNEFIDEFIKSLQEEKMIWERGWKIVLHRNFVSDVEYKGFNQLLLMYVAEKKGYAESQWLTFKQATEKNLKVKKGAKSVPIEFFTFYDKISKQNITREEYQQALLEGRKDEVRIFAKYYNIFNVQDLEGYEVQDEQAIENDISNLENYIKHSGLTVKFVGNQPCYIPSRHEIQMPPRKQFKNDDEYYATYLHEVGHSSMKHVKREFPKGVTTESQKRAFEELIAEISSVLLCCEFGIKLSSIQNNKAYIQSWIQMLKEDKEKYLLSAIKNANSITKYIMENVA